MRNIFEWCHLETKKYCTIIYRLCYWSKNLTTFCNVRALKLCLWQSAMPRCRNLDAADCSQPVSRPLACTDSLKYRDMLVVSSETKGQEPAACIRAVFIGRLVSRKSCLGAALNEWYITTAQWLGDRWYKIISLKLHHRSRLAAHAYTAVYPGRNEGRTQ